MRRLSILLAILIVINITACDSKTENYYKNLLAKQKKKRKNAKKAELLAKIVLMH